MGESHRRNIEWKKPNIKEHTPHDSTYMTVKHRKDNLYCLYLFHRIIFAELWLESDTRESLRVLKYLNIDLDDDCPSVPAKSYQAIFWYIFKIGTFHCLQVINQYTIFLKKE